MKEELLGDISIINPNQPKHLDGTLTCSFVPMESVDEKIGVIRQISQRKVAEVQKGYTFFRNKDIIFAKITPCMENGKCAIAQNLSNGIGFGSTEFHVIRPSEVVLPEWIYYYLRQDVIRIRAERRMTGSAGQRRVPSSFLQEELYIPLPPLAEQRRIAAILAKADRLRRLRRYALELSAGYLQAVFVEMFGDPLRNPKGWDRAIIEDIISLSQYGTSKKSNQEQRGYPILGMGNITYSGDIDLSSLAYVELTQGEAQKLCLEPGDIIFNRTNSTELVGKTACWRYNFDAVLASYLVKLRLNEQILSDYFVALLNSKHYKKIFQERCKKAVGQSNVSPTLLKEFPIMIPPLQLQQQFAEVVHKLERLRVQQQEAARQAEHLFQTLLQRAFRGELSTEQCNTETQRDRDAAQRKGTEIDSLQGVPMQERLALE